MERILYVSKIAEICFSLTSMGNRFEDCCKREFDCLTEGDSAKAERFLEISCEYNAILNRVRFEKSRFEGLPNEDGLLEDYRQFFSDPLAVSSVNEKYSDLKVSLGKAFEELDMSIESRIGFLDDFKSKVGTDDFSPDLYDSLVEESKGLTKTHDDCFENLAGVYEGYRETVEDSILDFRLNDHRDAAFKYQLV